jgi:hypothetical protein
MFQITEITHDVWIPEPRWSWYKSPIWRINATVMKIRTLDAFASSTMAGTGSITSKETAQIYRQYIYFTDEEFVLFKLSHTMHYRNYNMTELQQGLIYS